MKKSVLKQLAANAKYRMKNGYSQEEEHDKSILPSMENEERRIYNKMLEMSLDETSIFNPLSRLVDHSVFDKLNEIQKERYILELSNTYLKLLSRASFKR